ncbi:hypothetical protein EPUS_02731 [Endocarpon pusillum Z07020]|uniref:Ion transport domain-containing protein n=1 Tax=Endocarpon pusillum (strain Z07020 / HMAS-L-300199) TaxID=1263415 RepID=U1HE12_ENDPU|nr:uncharacterized protein EPUS_02731 [Endocarpon pusillum Z07020]ERF68275.1 hypothetical protein EPUS_02731 [Endocarpon pusillum Z07020]
MLSSLFRPSKGPRRQTDERSPFSSPSPEAVRQGPPNERSPLLRPHQNSATRGAERSETDDDDDADDAGFSHDEEEAETGNEDGHRCETSLLPIFSAAHLDALPIYNLTHAIRLLIVSKCETTLTWDQLRSPQVSQFLLKPIQQEVRAAHFSRATEYALMANCLQFNKEISLNPGNSGASKTRALVCELLAIKLLREYSTRELIDALSYDFDPLQGQSHPENNTNMSRVERTAKHNAWSPPRPARISCLEIAIRAQAKRFLAHPLVVQQLEAIWAGSIVFHAIADTLHRPGKGMREQTADALDQRHQPKSFSKSSNIARRSVTLYDPRDASLFKLSRLRVPRYRYFLSTGSYAILLGLFLAVLAQRSLEITSLEIVFWFWCAGYILDEIVGFNEQGFSLYWASFWNTFDLGILLLLIGHLCLRLYGIIMPDTRKHSVSNLAYDVLAADAVLLFPRLFSVLDHYRYFSQLLIAFRMMASDLMAVFVLILISCSGFFAALTLSFGDDTIDSPASVAYALFQMLMGFTPAAWDRWDNYNVLGKTILTLFLFICHFLVVTILITVLTNSFMAIVQNANEEHQFVFAVNTISMVKSDALFSYIAPTNIIAWFITPLRYFVPFRRFVKINRTLIKITHFPILFSIFLYEKIMLRSSVVDTVEIIEPRGRPPADINRSAGISIFTPHPRRQVREASVATWRKDRALAAVFRRPYDGTLRDTSKSHTRQRTSKAVTNWMQNLGEEGVMSPPQEQDRAVVDRLEGHRIFHRRPRFARPRRDHTNITRSIASDPEDFGGFTDVLTPSVQRLPAYQTTPSHEPNLEHEPEPAQATDADGDDELVTSDNEDDGMIFPQRPHNASSPVSPLRTARPDGYFSTRSPKPKNRESSTSVSSPPLAQSRSWRAEERHTQGEVTNRVVQRQRPRPHLRNVSSATIIYNPVTRVQSSPPSKKQSATRGTKSIGIRSPKSGAMTPAAKSLSNTPGRRTPKKFVSEPARAQAILPPKNDPTFMSAPNLTGMMRMHNRGAEHRRSSLDMDLGSDIGDNKAIGGGFVGAIPASFATQMAYATGGLRRQAAASEDQEMFGRLVLARMNKLEEGMKEVIHEMRESRMNESNNSRSRSKERSSRPSRQPMKKSRHREKEKRDSEKEKRRPVIYVGGPKSRSAAASSKATDKEQDWEDEAAFEPAKSGSI